MITGNNKKGEYKYFIGEKHGKQQLNGNRNI